MALLVLAGWFAQSLANVARVDLGFRADSLSVFSIAPERNGYTPAQSAALFARLEEELAQIPGVTSVGAAAVPLLDEQQLGQQRHRRRVTRRRPARTPTSPSTR